MQVKIADPNNNAIPLTIYAVIPRLCVSTKRWNFGAYLEPGKLVKNDGETSAIKPIMAANITRRIIHNAKVATGLFGIAGRLKTNPHLAHWMRSPRFPAKIRNGRRPPKIKMRQPVPADDCSLGLKNFLSFPQDGHAK